MQGLNITGTGHMRPEVKAPTKTVHRRVYSYGNEINAFSNIIGEAIYTPPYKPGLTYRLEYIDDVLSFFGVVDM